jgi:sacsin
LKNSNFFSGISGTNLTGRFCDQFSPMMIGQNMSWSLSDSTIIRMPLSSECLKDGLEIGLKRIKQITDRFLEHGSRTLLFLKSILQVLTVMNDLANHLVSVAIGYRI